MNIKRQVLIGWGMVMSMGMANANTQMHTFTPTLNNNPKIAGECWTNSIASNRPDAWRCMTGNTIHDPCFTTNNQNYLVCDANPITKNPGIILQLKKPLPKSDLVQTMQMVPWIMQLEDGNICQPFTGTKVTTDAGVVNYSCQMAKPQQSTCESGLLENSIQQGDTWTATLVTYCGNAKVKNKKPVNILQVWS
jgi:hypothetical protein